MHCQMKRRTEMMLKNKVAVIYGAGGPKTATEVNISCGALMD